MIERALAHDVRRDLAGRRVDARGHVQRVVVVEQIDLRALRRLGVLDGVHLVKVVDARRAGPRGVVERAVDDGARGRARDMHGLLARDPGAAPLPEPNAQPAHNSAHHAHGMTRIYF